MKHKSFLFICSLSCLIFLVGCEKQIDIDIEDMEPQVVVSAQGEVGMPLSVDLTYSRPVYGSFYVYNGEDYFPKITDATVSLSVNGGSAVTASCNGGTYTFAHMPQPGEQLTLTIAVPGKDQVTATATVPQMPIVGDLVVTSRDEQPDIDGNTNTDLTFTVPLTDRGGSTDYYAISLCRYDTIVYIYYDSTGAPSDTVIDYYIQDWFECQDQMIVNQIDVVDALEGVAVPSFYGSEMLFTDALIDGTTRNIDLLTYISTDWYRHNGRYMGDHYNDSYTVTVSCTFKVEVSAISRDLYLYRQTKNSYSDDELLGFFSEPVQIHSNIDGGIGIFGVSSKTSSTYRMDFNQQ